MTEDQIAKKISDYEKKYKGRFPAPKYMLFIQRMIKAGWSCRYKEVSSSRSKYLWVEKGDKKYKIRFSDHNIHHDGTDDIDYVCGGKSKNGVPAYTADALFVLLNGV